MEAWTINQKTRDPFSIPFFDNNLIPAGVDFINNSDNH